MLEGKAVDRAAQGWQISTFMFEVFPNLYECGLLGPFLSHLPVTAAQIDFWLLVTLSDTPLVLRMVASYVGECVPASGWALWHTC